MALTTNLPSDVATLQTLLQDSEERNGRKDDRIERLEKLVADFKRALFGSKSEKVSTDQYELALEDIEAAIDRPMLRSIVLPSSECGATNQHLLMSGNAQRTERAKVRSSAA